MLDPKTNARHALALAAACAATLSAHAAQADTRTLVRARSALTRASAEHPSFRIKLEDRVSYRADTLGDPESACGVTPLQHVREYDGSAGQSRSFVDAHEGPVGKLEQPLCSGTLIARNLFLTASHCVDATTPGRTVAFEFEKLAGSNGVATPIRYVIDEVVEDGANLSAPLDYAVLRLRDQTSPTPSNPGDTFGITTLEPLMPALEHVITIIQHPGGEPKQVGVGHLYAYADDATYMRYNDLDTQGGSSGSGILDDAGRLVGLHTNGGCDDEDPEKRFNSGVRLDQIVRVSATVRGLLPPTLLARVATVRELELHDVGEKYGVEGDEIDVEAVLHLEGSDQAYGFTLRTGTDEEAHRGMLKLVRKAFRSQTPVRVEFTRETHRTNRILRVVRQ